MDIEKLATSAVEESISLTDELSHFINSGDKEPSWDGNIYIYADKQKRKKGIKKVPVQIKGEIYKKLPPKKEPKFSVSLDDLKNWLNDGGVVLFVVLMNESGKEKIIYYNCLIPIKIRKFLEGNQSKKTKRIPLKRFPEDNNQKVSILLNFYDHMQKQTSFANAPLFSLEELEEKGVLEKVSFSATTYGKPKSEYDVETAFIQSEPYIYATITGSAVPQPILEIPSHLHIAREIAKSVKVRDRLFYKNYRTVRNAESSTIVLGKSTSLEIKPDSKSLVMTFHPTGMLSDYIYDTEFILDVLEKQEIDINGIVIPFTNSNKSKLAQYRKLLSYYQDVKKMLDFMGVRKELRYFELNEKDKGVIRACIDAVVYGKNIEFTECANTMVFGRFKIGNLLLLIWADKASEGGYKLQSYFSNHKIALFDDRDEHMEHPYPISHYSLLKKQDFLDGANIDYQKIVDDLDSNDTSPLVMEQLTLFMLEMLKACDELAVKEEELLFAAEKYSDWLIENSEQLDDTLILNRLQIIKRKREFEESEIQQLQKMRKDSTNLSIKCAANLLLGRNESAQDCFDEMNMKEKERFIKFPICHFGKLTYASDKEN